MKSGILLLDKPSDQTSFDCIRRLKKILNRKDLGHAGTLDRFATGLLPVFFGEALKLARFFQEPYPTLSSYWKTYEGLMCIGQTTDTLDPSGQIVSEKLLRNDVSIHLLKEEMNTFRGKTYFQTPPLYSAKKIDGKRASDRAREGQEVALDPVQVEIRSFDCEKIESQPNGTLFIWFKTTCSKGTYIRSLARDFAENLNSVAHLRELRRTHVANFSVQNAHRFEDLETNLEEKLLNLKQACDFLPQVSLLETEVSDAKNGSFRNFFKRLATSSLKAQPYCVVAGENPVALIEKTLNQEFRLLRGFVDES